MQYKLVAMLKSNCLQISTHQAGVSAGSQNKFQLSST